MNKANNSLVVNEKIKEAAAQVGLHPTAFMRFCTAKYLEGDMEFRKQILTNDNEREKETNKLSLRRGKSD